MSVLVNHNYPSENALRVLKANGEPVQDATINIYEHTPYNANPATAVAVGQTTTDVDGLWKDTITLDDGRTWMVVVAKASTIDTRYWEITT